MRIEKVTVGEINPAVYNPRKDLEPGDPEYEKLRHSMEEFDCVEPLVWNERTGNLVGGHQRLKVLVARGDQEVLCSVGDLPPDMRPTAHPPKGPHARRRTSYGGDGA